MKIPVVLAFVATIALAGCPSPAPIWPGPDATDASPFGEPDASAPSVPDGALPVVFTDAPFDTDCVRAEANLVKLDCKDSRGQSLAVTKGGQRFAAVCRAAFEAGVDVRPACLSVASSCKEAAACSIR